MNVSLNSNETTIKTSLLPTEMLGSS